MIYNEENIHLQRFQGLKYVLLKYWLLSMLTFLKMQIVVYQSYKALNIEKALEIIM